MDISERPQRTDREKRFLGFRCEQCIKDLLVKWLAESGMRYENRMAKDMLYKPKALSQWDAIDVYELLSINNIQPIAREDFPAEFWNEIIFPSRTSILARAKLFFTTDRDLDFDWKERHLPPGPHELETRAYRNFAWFVLSIAATWWEMMRAELYGKPKQIAAATPENTPQDMDRELKVGNQNPKKKRKARLTPQKAFKLVKDADCNVSEAARKYGCCREYMSRLYNQWRREKLNRKKL